MLSLVSPDVDRYLGGLALHKDSVLRRMEKQSIKENFPIVGPQVGRLLMLLAKSIRAKRVFEIGSGFGYSALWFAKALPKEGRVTLTDFSQLRSQQSLKYFTQAKQAQKAKCLIGDVAKHLSAARGTFDIIFLDADKARYPYFLKKAWPKLRRGGLFIVDNVLWSGRVVRKATDAETKGIQQFNRIVARMSGAISMIVPLRDGLSVSLKVTVN